MRTLIHLYLKFTRHCAAFYARYRLSPGSSHGEDVRLQEVGEEADKEAEGGGDGADREADPAEDKLQVRGEPRVRLRDQGCPVSGADYNERRRPEIPYLQHGRRARLGHR